MYISTEIHDAICTAGAWAIGIMLAVGVVYFMVATVIPRIWENTIFFRMRLAEEVLYRRYKRAEKRYRRAARRYKQMLRRCESNLSFFAMLTGGDGRR